MKPIFNSIKLVICPKSKTCRNNYTFSNNTICGHHLPHPHGSICGGNTCGVERDVICESIEEVHK